MVGAEGLQIADAFLETYWHRLKRFLCLIIVKLLYLLLHNTYKEKY